MMRSILALAALAPAPALACGGFFCDVSQPVEQAGERIVFAIDEEQQRVEVHVAITYRGEAERFAWVVPAPALPELFLSTDQLFSAIEPLTRPVWAMEYVEEGDCDKDIIIRAQGQDTGCWNCDFDEVAEADSGGSGITIVATQEVGPFDTTTLLATDSGALLEWLQDNGYDLPDTLGPALDPYIADASYFVAVKLTKGAEVGDIAPLGMRYAGSKPVIPIQLTSVAAVPDMPVTVWVLAGGRAVPENYLHVKVNEVAIDWFSWGNNYASVITRAADEAGGQGFATDMASPTTTLHDAVVRPGQFTGVVDSLAGASDPAVFMDNLQGTSLTANALLLGVLEDCIDLPEGTEAVDFFNCPSCYTELWDGWSSAACAAELEARIIDPLLSAGALIERYPYLTRLTSSMSAEEMTADPLFVINPDMEAVERVRQARLFFECGDGGEAREAPRRLELPGGSVVPLPSHNALKRRGIDYLEWVALAAANATEGVERTSADAAPELVIDNRDAIAEALQALLEESDVPVGGGDQPIVGGCGCSGTGSLPAGLGLSLGLLALLRRRP